MCLILCLFLFLQNGVVHSAVDTDVPDTPNTLNYELGQSGQNPLELLLNYLGGVVLFQNDQKQSALVTYDEFANGVQSAQSDYPRPSQEKYMGFMGGLPRGDISTKEEAAMALAQILHESDGLRAKVEYNPELHDYSEPDCDAPGKLYYGRGYIQLTGCKNYRKASMDLFQNDRLVQDPDAVAREEQLAWDTAFNYWKYAVHPASGVAEGQFGVTTRQINDARECSGGDPTVPKKRYAMYGRIRAVWGLPGPGIENGCYN